VAQLQNKISGVTHDRDFSERGLLNRYLERVRDLLLVVYQAGGWLWARRAS